jgi:hypothetical protein
LKSPRLISLILFSGTVTNLLSLTFAAVYSWPSVGFDSSDPTKYLQNYSKSGN